MLSTGERSRNQPVRVAKQLLGAARFWFLHSLSQKRTLADPLFDHLFPSKWYRFRH